jgi:nitroimidazol reductase NimA-like FMN-containing flavoprotein (pyridoxamine 5'-phosphate oxidase superfamily)
LKNGLSLSGVKEVRDRIRKLFDSQRLAVLATHRGGQPYTSLVAFAASEDLGRLLFATTRATRKFANLSADARVSLLVDNRTNRTADFRRAMAVTGVGRAREVEGIDRAASLELYLRKHPHLEDFVAAPTCALLQVAVEAYYAVTRFQHVVELRPWP